MATIQANGLSVVEAVIQLPRVGAWVGDIVVDTQDVTQVNGAITLDLNGQMSLQGKARIVGDFLGSRRVRVVGGAGGLTAIASPKAYSNNPTARIILSDLVNQGGEALSSTIIGSLLSVQFPAWTTLAQPISTVITQVVSVLPAGNVWRILPDGTLWIGTDTYPVTSVPYQVLRFIPEQGRIDVGVESPILMPGIALPTGQNVSSVTIEARANEIRQSLWYSVA